MIPTFKDKINGYRSYKVYIQYIHLISEVKNEEDKN